MLAENVVPLNLNLLLITLIKDIKALNEVEPSVQGLETGHVVVDLLILRQDRSVILARRKNLPRQLLEYDRLD